MSFKGTMFHYILKYRHLMKGKLKAEVIDENSDINLIRRESEEAAEKLVKKLRELLVDRLTFRIFMQNGLKLKMLRKIR